MFEKPCPFCGSKAMYYNGSMCTLMATPPPESDEDGNVTIHPNPNITTDNYTCKKCGKNFEVTT